MHLLVNGSRLPPENTTLPHVNTCRCQYSLEEAEEALSGRMCMVDAYAGRLTSGLKKEVRSSYDHDHKMVMG